MMRFTLEELEHLEKAVIHRRSSSLHLRKIIQFGRTEKWDKAESNRVSLLATIDSKNDSCGDEQEGGSENGGVNRAELF